MNLRDHLQVQTWVAALDRRIERWRERINRMNHRVPAM